MTKRQMKVLEYIKSYWDENGYSPSYDDIKDAMGISSRSNVHRIVHCLVERGYLRNIPQKARSLVIVDNSLAKSQGI